MKFPIPALLFLLPLQPLTAQDMTEAAPAESPAEEPAPEPAPSTPPEAVSPTETTPATPAETVPTPETTESAPPATPTEPTPAAMEITAESTPPSPSESAPAPQPAPTLQAEVEEDPATQLAKSLNFQSGEILIGGGVAALKLPDNLRYLSPEDTEKLLVELWGNPTGDDTLGTILPANVSPLDPACWAVILTYEEDGYVSDEDADEIDYNDLLKEMQDATLEDSKAREEEGYSSIALVGWAAQPRYNREAHQLYWAKELHFGGNDVNTLNYNLRLLGRRGVLNLNVVAEMKQLAEIEANIPSILQTASFTESNRYADFNPATDKIAEYGLAALVTGGLLAAGKGGLFKIILAGLIAFKKVILIGVLGLGSMAFKLFKKSKAGA